MMKNWKHWLFLAVMTAVMVVAGSFEAIDISHGKVPPVAAVCFILLIFLGGVLVGCYGRNKTLDLALIACYGASLSLFEWFCGWGLFSPILWMAFALLSAYISWQSWKARRSCASSLRSGEGND